MFEVKKNINGKCSHDAEFKKRVTLPTVSIYCLCTSNGQRQMVGQSQEAGQRFR
jgi:hypothetical protein